jgi:hypothetical protein
MGVDAGMDPGLRCRTCGHGNRVGDRFCEQCGAHLVPPPRPEPPARPRPTGSPPPPARDRADRSIRDGTTRYLCAAAHLDPQFAQRAIGEYLIEGVRAVPPSPGLDVVAVLRDAVAARRRGKIRDGVLLLLLVLCVILCFGPTVLWVLVAIGAAAATKDSTEHSAEQRASRKRTQLVVVLVVLGVAVLISFTAAGTRLLQQFGFSGFTGASVAIPLVMSLLVLAVLFTDEAVVDELTRNRFRRANFQPDGQKATGWERTARTLGLTEFAGALRRVAVVGAAPGEGSADVVVHRGWVPFIGSGTMVTDQTLSLPLERADEDREPAPFTAEELNGHVREALAELRSSASLSPGRRLASAQIHEQVYLPSDQLAHLADTPLAGVLPDLDEAPTPCVDVALARALADQPIEAGRYYLCLRIEAWDRDLATSCFFTAATDRRTLYLEWSNSVLLPLRSRYREIDRPAEIGPGSRALLAALTLPATAPARTANLFHSFKRIPSRPGELVADRYGAAKSLRELAAAPVSDNFFQDADAVRYLTLVEQALFRAVGEFLQARGYSITEVLSAARSRIANNSITINGGTFTNSAVGIGRTQQSTAGADAAPGQQRRSG